MPRIFDGPRCNLVGGTIKKYRLQRKMSQKELADKLETVAVYICRGSISRIESGERTVTDIEIEGISKILGVSVDVLFCHKNVEANI